MVEKHENVKKSLLDRLLQLSESVDQYLKHLFFFSKFEIFISFFDFFCN